MGDGAYTADSRVLFPFARDDLGADGNVQRIHKMMWNYRLRRQRVLVEWIIGRLRRTWQILHNRFVLDRVRSTEIVRCCSLLINYMYNRREEWPGPEERDAIADEVPVGYDDHIV